MKKLKDIVAFRKRAIEYLKTIPLEEIKKQYVDLRLPLLNHGFISGKINCTDINIKESVEETLSIDEVRNQLRKTFQFNDWQIKGEIGENNIRIICFIANIGINDDILISAMNDCGWTISTKSIINISGMDLIAYNFDPMFQVAITDEITDYKYLYHLSPSINDKSIMMNGLIPKSENKRFKYPNRVHIFKGNTPEKEIIKLGKRLYIASGNENSNYTLYKIIVEQLPNDIDFFYDPRYEFGYYTKQTIPIDCIQPYAIMDMKTDNKFNYLT